MTQRDPRNFPFPPQPTASPVAGPYPSRANFEPFAGPVTGTGPYAAGQPADPNCRPGLPIGEMPRLAPQQNSGAPVQLQPASQLVVPETAPDKLIRPKGFAALGAGDTQDDVIVTWNDDGYVLGMKFGVKNCASMDALVQAMSSLSVKVQVGGEAGYLTLDGVSQQYVTFGELCGYFGQVWLPFYRAVVRREVWTIYMQNEGTSEVAFVPTCTFKLRSLASLGLY